MDPETTASHVVDACIQVHRDLGPGLYESVYERCLKRALEVRGLLVARQVPQPLIYLGEELGSAFKLDLVVNNQVVVEIKSVDAFAKVYFAQIATYLKLSGYPIGFLANFNTVPMKSGLRRWDRDEEPALAPAP